MQHGIVGTLLAGILAAGSAEGAIYRCERGGQVTYTDKACTAFAESHAPAAPLVVVDAGPQADLAGDFDRRRERERDANARARAQDGEWLRAHGKRRAREARLREARVARKAIRGMRPDDVIAALGAPDDVERSEDEQGARERWTFRRDGGVQTVTFINGEVSGVQTAKGRSKRRR